MGIVVLPRYYTALYRCLSDKCGHRWLEKIPTGELLPVRIRCPECGKLTGTFNDTGV